jgi:hypothetical protein
VTIRIRLAMVCFIFGALSLMASGCGEEGAKVTGSVTKDGKAQEGVSVSFITQDKEKGASKGTRTNAEGKFELKMKPGHYTVILAKWVDKNGKVPKDSDDPNEDFAQLEASGKLRQVLPSKFTETESSPFNVEIPATGKQLPPFDVK